MRSKIVHLSIKHGQKSDEIIGGIMEFFSRFLRRVLVVSLFASSSIFAASSTQRLACFYYDTSHPEDSIGSFNPTFPSVWAKGADDEDIYVSGTVRDGFFAITSVKGKEQGYFSNSIINRYENSDALAHEFCMRGLFAMFPDSYEDFAILHLGVKPSFLSSKYLPVVFKHHQNNHIKSIDKLVVFGDSLSDQGNLKRFIKIFPTEPYFAGRFSDYWIWVDYFKKMNGLAVQNWAIGGSLSDDNRIPLTGLETFAERVRLKVRTMASGSVRSEISRYRKNSLLGGQILDGDSTFFVLWAGGNDYIYLLEKPDDADTFLDTPYDSRVGQNVMMARVINNVMTHAQTLYTLGARHFLIANMPDLGKTPSILENVAYHRSTNEPLNQRIFLLSAKMSELTRLHNIRLGIAVENFKKQHPDATASLVDVALGSEQAVKSVNIEDGVSYFDYDFDTQFCQPVTFGDQTIMIHRSCYGVRGLIPDESQVCEQPHRALFWDGVHPSSYAHCLIAAFFHQSAARLGALNPSSLNEYLGLCRPDLVS